MLTAVVGMVLGWGDDGRDGRWHARYARGDGQASFERFEPDVRLHWGRRAPREGWPTDGFRQRFETCLALPEPRPLPLLLGTEDQASVWLGDQQVLEVDGDAAYRERRVSVAFERPTALVVETHDRRGPSSVQLWYEDAAGRHPLPAGWLRRPPCP